MSSTTTLHTEVSAVRQDALDTLNSIEDTPQLERTIQRLKHRLRQCKLHTHKPRSTSSASHLSPEMLFRRAQQQTPSLIQKPSSNYMSWMTSRTSTLKHLITSSHTNASSY